MAVEETKKKKKEKRKAEWEARGNGMRRAWGQRRHGKASTRRPRSHVGEGAVVEPTWVEG